MSALIADWLSAPAGELTRVVVVGGRGGLHRRGGGGLCQSGAAGQQHGGRERCSERVLLHVGTSVGTVVISLGRRLSTAREYIRRKSVAIHLHHAC